MTPTVEPEHPPTGRPPASLVPPSLAARVPGWVLVLVLVLQPLLSDAGVRIDSEWLIEHPVNAPSDSRNDLGIPS